VSRVERATVAILVYSFESVVRDRSTLTVTASTSVVT
jgi:hypothetical protein